MPGFRRRGLPSPREASPQGIGRGVGGEVALPRERVSMPGFWHFVLGAIIFQENL
jgi:hypothetical protein